MKSILQDGRTYCFLCGQNSSVEPLDEHHVYSGAYRNASEKYGLKVYLHHSKCHIFGKYSVHQNAAIAKDLKAKVQRIAMEHYRWDEEDFRRIFGKSYL